ncbi:MAG TPA: dihydropteroate synthase, partial [Steroidobacteraceae bacterium]|nr:dihydropteroate synthase [Steroidobacteraceae bacterium]
MLLRCRSRTLDLAQPCVMGILNVTPDSFSDGGLHFDRERAVEAGLRMVEEGAAIIDVGGESTRPGAAPVSAAEEIDRVAPVIEALARRTATVLSVDSSKPEVITAALQAGAHLVNDVRALRLPGALEAAAAGGAAVCVMHMRGEPATMQDDPRYDDVVREVREFLVERVAACRAAGIHAESICVDPGIGFAKTAQHNLALLRNLRSFTDLGGPLLIGVSRKSLIGMITGRPPAGRTVGSATMAALCVERGAKIVRAHDVAATVDAVKVASVLQQQ